MKSTSFQPVGEYKTVQEFVTENVRLAIIQGVLLPGQKLHQDDIAKKFNSSRMPVREALRTLEAEGLVKFVPNKGAVVAELSAQELEEIYSIRAVLESMAGRLAIAKITPEPLQRIVQIKEEMDVLVDDRDEWLKLSNQFHREIYKVAERPRLLALIEELKNITEPYARRYLDNMTDLQAAQHEHALIVKALENRDVDRLEQEIKSHLHHISKVLVDLKNRNAELFA